MLKRLQQKGDSAGIQIQDTQDGEANERMVQNTRNILHLQEEIRARQKKAAIIRIGIGVLLMGVLVIGLLRKRKKKTVLQAKDSPP